MSKGHRQKRIGEEIRKIISEFLLHGLKDPRLNSMISITAVEVSGDNSYATIYFAPLIVGEDTEEALQEQEETLEAFAKASGFIRKKIGSEMKLRHVPELIFKVDHSLEYSRRIESVLNDL